jgi:hypothetical protein
VDVTIKKKSIFIAQIESCQEVDAILPIIWKIKQSKLIENSEYSVFLPIIPNNYDDFLSKTLSIYKIRVIFPHNIFLSKSFTKGAEKTESFINIFLKLIFKASFRSRLFYKWYMVLLERCLNKNMSDYAFCYMPFASLRKEIHNPYIQSFYNYFLLNKKTIIGFDSHGFHDINGLTKSDSLFSMVLNKYQPTSDDLNINSHYHLIGSPRFDKRYIDDFMNKTCDLYPKIKTKLPNKEKNVLLLLKTLSVRYEDVISDEEKYKYRDWLISFIISQGYNIIIKPHPRENKQTIEDWILKMSSKSNKKLIVSHGNTLTMINYCSLVVCEFPTEANFDVFASDHKVIWLFNKYLSECNDDNFNKYVAGLTNNGFHKSLFENLDYNI